MKHLLFTLTTFCFLFVVNFDAFSQGTKKGKLVKCYEKGKVVYRTKCKTVIKKKEVNELPYGDPNSKYEIASDGPGSGVGQGVGRGQGSGNGTGSGAGNGSGSGAGTGDNTEQTIPKPPTTNNGGTTALKILSKPRVSYTDEARKNQVQGTVTLRITFLANGTIGTISTVSGLPDGLTEKAKEAAKMIKFTPATKDGKPVTVTKQIQYSFTLY